MAAERKRATADERPQRELGSMPADPTAAELFDFLAADLGPVRVNLSFRDWLRERLWETLASCLARHPSRH